MATKAKAEVEEREELAEATEEGDSSAPDPVAEAERIIQEYNQKIMPRLIRDLAAEHKIPADALTEYLGGEQIKDVADLEAKAARFAKSVAKAMATPVNSSRTNAALATGATGSAIHPRTRESIMDDYAKNPTYENRKAYEAIRPA